MYIRNCVRAVIENEFNEILLERFEFRNVIGNKVLWVTPGGGIKNNETAKEALVRELSEELGIKIDIKSEPIAEIDVLIEGKKESFISREIFYKIEVNSNSIFSTKNMTEEEKDTFRGLKWYKKDELNNLENFAPQEVLDFLK